MSEIRRRLLKRFRDRDYRHSYLDAFLNSLISTQIRTLREERGWTQGELGEEIDTNQSAISRIESPNYSSWRIDTLRRLARAFDRALIVKFVSFGDAVDDIERFGVDRLIRPSFDKDPTFQGGSESGAPGTDTLAKVLDFGNGQRWEPHGQFVQRRAEGG